MITKNSADIIGKSLQSVAGLADEVVIIDNHSTDATLHIASKFGAKIIQTNENNLGKKRRIGLEAAKYDWILSLDTDELVSDELRREIQLIEDAFLNGQYSINGFEIPFHNHFLGKTLRHGGENYRMLRLFRKDSAKIEPKSVHEHFEVKGRIENLNNFIFHYSYRSLSQMFGKFTRYSISEADQKYISGEKSSFKKIFLYPLHMFYARYIKDRGYEDGVFRIPLDLGFAYMEFLTYFRLWLMNRQNS